MYQITFFVALLVADEARVQSRRRDCLCCCKVSREQGSADEKNNNPDPESYSLEAKNDKTQHLSSKAMSWYADKLLLPWVKAAVIVAFTILFGLGAWSATKLRVNFDFRSVLPSDSYVNGFYEALNAYSNGRGPEPYIYFRNVNQSDPEIWEQMEAYVDAVVGIDAVTKPPFRFWLRDYKEFVANNEYWLYDYPFNQRLQEFLYVSEYSYHNDIKRDEEGYIVASRTSLKMDNVDAIELSSGVNALRALQMVSMEQPVNQQHSDEWDFFTFDRIFLLWEFLRQTPDLILNSTITGLLSVMVMSIFFIPHWSGIFLVSPMMIFMYVDVLGILHWFGISINGLSYVSLLMAIGLLVDFVMHVVLRYFESTETSSRDARVKNVLRTMGASVLLGGLSTFLGVVPLMFSSSDIIYTFVVTFFAVVFLGKFDWSNVGISKVQYDSLTPSISLLYHYPRTFPRTYTATRRFVVRRSHERPYSNKKKH